MITVQDARKEWQDYILSEIIESITTGYSISGKDPTLTEEEKGVLTLSSVGNSSFDPTKYKAIRKEDTANLRTSVKANTILISRSNTIDLVGASVYVYQDYPDLFLSDLIWEIQLKKGFTSYTKYLNFLLASSPIKKELQSRASGTSGSMKKLSQKRFGTVSISLPPLEEQKKIVEILSTCDRAIELTEKLIAAKRNLKRGLMQQLLTGKVRFPEFEGQKWKKLPLGQLCEIKIGGTPSRRKPSYWSGSENEGFTWVSISDMNQRFITKTKEKITQTGVENSNVKLIPKGTTMISFKLTIGKVAQAGCDLYTNEAIAGFLPKEDDLVIQDYLYEALPIFVSYASTDTAIKGAILNKQKLKILPITLPSLLEQKKICSLSNLLDEEINQIEQQLDRLQQQKKGLMQQLLTGKTPVPVNP